jgi:hypothetical protein
MKNGEAPWKWRAVENQGNQTQVSLVSLHPWKSQLRFPHSHRADDGGPFPGKSTTKAKERSSGIAPT